MRQQVEFAKSVDTDEVAHYEPPHLDLHSLPASLEVFNMKKVGLHIFFFLGGGEGGGGIFHMKILLSAFLRALRVKVLLLSQLSRVMQHFIVIIHNKPCKSTLPS